MYEERILKAEYEYNKGRGECYRYVISNLYIVLLLILYTELLSVESVMEEVVAVACTALVAFLPVLANMFNIPRVIYRISVLLIIAMCIFLYYERKKFTVFNLEDNMVLTRGNVEQVIDRMTPNGNVLIFNVCASDVRESLRRFKSDCEIEVWDLDDINVHGNMRLLEMGNLDVVGLYRVIDFVRRSGGRRIYVSRIKVLDHPSKPKYVRTLSGKPRPTSEESADA